MILKNKTYSPIYYKGIDLSPNFDPGKPSGYLSAFQVRDSQKDVIHKGAFKRSLETRGAESNSTQKIAYLKYHDMERPIGRFTKLIEDETGLYFEAILDDTIDGQETKTQYESRSLNQHSIGFNYIWDNKAIKYSEEEDTFHVFDVVLWEGSAVVLGSNPETPFLGFKSETFEEKQNELYDYIESIVKGLDSKTQYNIRAAFMKSLNLIEMQKEAATKALIKANEIDKKLQSNQHQELLNVSAVIAGVKNKLII